MTRNSTHVPKDWQAYYDSMTAITDAVCRKHLNDEYAELARQALAALCRKRPSPLTSGHKQVWCCAVVYALGQVNFLSDRSEEPYMAMADLCAAFDVAGSTAANKAKVVRGLLKLRRLDPRWTLPSKMDRNPLVWLLEVGGFVVDVRQMPRDVQELAFAKGLIPYMPADR